MSYHVKMDDEQVTRHIVLTATLPAGIAPYLPIIVFDGECALCNRLSGWLLARQSRRPEMKFTVVGAESLFGRQLLCFLQLERLAESTILYVSADSVLTKMDASYAIWRRLRFPWSWVPFFYAWLPTGFLNLAYDFIAASRRRRVCTLEDRAWRKQFAGQILDTLPFPVSSPDRRAN